MKLVKKNCNKIIGQKDLCFYIKHCLKKDQTNIEEKLLKSQIQNKKTRKVKVKNR